MKTVLLLCALVLLCVPRTTASFLSPEGDLCYNWLYGKEPYGKDFQCHEWRDGTEVKICCGTCSPPCCCSSEGSLINHHWCPAEVNPSVAVKTVEVFISPFTKIMEHWMIFLSVSCGVILAFAVSLCLYYKFKRFLIRRRIRKLKQERRRQRALCRQRRVSDTLDTNDAVRGDAVREDAVQKGAVGRDAVREDVFRKDAVGEDSFHDGAVRRKRPLRRHGIVSDTPDTSDAVHDDAMREDAVQDDSINEDPVVEISFRDGAVRCKRPLRRHGIVSDTPDTNDAVHDDAMREDVFQDDGVREDAFRDGAVRRKRPLCRQRKVSDTPGTTVAIVERPVSPSGMGVSPFIQPAPHLSGPAVRFHRGSDEDVVAILPSAAEEAPPYKITVARRYSS